MLNRDHTKKITKIFLISIIILIIIGYALFESESLIKGPEIIIYEPKSGSVSTSSSILIKGKALRIQDITMNERTISIDKEGNFEEILLLSKGYNVTLISANDKFNRTIKYKLELVYKN